MITNEIKEILEYVLSLTYGNENAIKGINKVEDYITNLQKCYCNRTDCVGRIKDSKKYDSLQERIDKVKEYVKEMCYVDDEYGYCNYGDNLSPEHIIDLLENKND